MIILNEKPPIYELAHKYFDIDDTRTVYTFGDVLFNPAGVEIDNHLKEHELTHVRQQSIYESGAEGWWERYVIDKDFRLTQEVEAYANQFNSYCTEEKARERQVKFLWLLATDLSGPTYKLNIGIFVAYGMIKLKAKEINS